MGKDDSYNEAFEEGSVIGACVMRHYGLMESFVQNGCASSLSETNIEGNFTDAGFQLMKAFCGQSYLKLLFSPYNNIIKDTNIGDITMMEIVRDEVIELTRKSLAEQ